MNEPFVLVLWKIIFMCVKNPAQLQSSLFPFLPLYHSPKPYPSLNLNPKTILNGTVTSCG